MSSGSGSSKCCDVNSKAGSKSIIHPTKLATHKGRVETKEFQDLGCHSNTVLSLKNTLSNMSTRIRKVPETWKWTTHIWLLFALLQLLIPVSTAETKLNVQRFSVMTGQSVRLTCSVNFPGRVNWRHESVGTGSLNNVYMDGFGIVGFFRSRGRHSIEKETNNLMIVNVTDSDAGNYACEDTVLEENVDEFEVVILKTMPTCNSNIRLADVIGENDCGVDPDEIRLHCSVVFYGNFAPILRWWNSGGEHAMIDADVSIPFREDINTTTNTLILTARKYFSDTYFTCQVVESQSTVNVPECRTEKLTVHYFINSFPILRTTDNDELISCESQNRTGRSCRYHWITEHKDNKPSAVGPVLNPREHAFDRTFVCFVECQIRNRTCYSMPLIFHTQGKGESTHKTVDVIVVTVTTVFYLITICVMCIAFRRYSVNDRFRKLLNSLHTVPLPDPDTMSDLNDLALPLLEIHELHRYTESVNRKLSVLKSSSPSITDFESYSRSIHPVPFKLIKALGGGYYSITYLVMHDSYGEVVLKIQKASSAVEKSEFNKEAEILQKLVNPHIVKFFNADFSDLISPVTVFVMEYVKFGPVFDFMREFSVPCHCKMQISLDVSRALSYLHSQKPCIIHGDLKPENILIDDNYRAKVSDFGLACSQRIMRTLTKIPVRGTLPYIAPEYLIDPRKQKTEKFDVYGFGISIWEIFSEKHHSDDFKVHQIKIKFVVDGARPLLSEITDKHTVSKKLLTLIETCWKKEEQMRPSFDKISDILSQEISCATFEEQKLYPTPNLVLMDEYDSADVSSESGAEVVQNKSVLIKSPSDHQTFVNGFQVLELSLAKYIDSNNEFLESLIMKGVITRAEYAELTKITSYTDRNNRMIMHCIKPKIMEKCKGFVEALIENHQEHIVKFILYSGNSDNRSITSDDRVITNEELKLIDNNMFGLVNLINPIKMDFLNRLVSNNCIANEHAKRVESHKQASEKVNELLTILKRRRYKDLCNFKQCLKDTMQGRLVELLERPGLVVVNVNLERNLTEETQSTLIAHVTDYLENKNKSSVSDLLKVLDEDGIHLIGNSSWRGIVVFFMCTSANSLRLMQHKYESGSLQNLLENVYRSLSESDNYTTHLINRITLYKHPFRTSDLSSELLLVDKVAELEDSNVVGVTWLENQLFVVHENDPSIHVFSTDEPYNELSNIEIPGICAPCDITSSIASQALFTIDGFKECFWRMQMPERKFFKFPVVGQPKALSITPSDYLLIVLRGRNNQRRYSLTVYEQRGFRIHHTIQMPDMVHAVYSAIELTKSTYAICYRDRNSPHQYLIGQLTYGGKTFSRVSALYFPEMIKWGFRAPVHLSMDNENNVYMAVNSHLGDQIFMFNHKKNELRTLLNKNQHDVDIISKLGFIQEKQQLIVAHSSKSDLSSVISIFSFR